MEEEVEVDPSDPLEPSGALPLITAKFITGVATSLPLLWLNIVISQLPSSVSVTATDKPPVNELLCCKDTTTTSLTPIKVLLKVKVKKVSALSASGV